MECKAEQRKHQFITSNRIDLTRMEFKGGKHTRSARMGASIDLTRMEFKGVQYRFHEG